jgi:hypothetical protein
MREPLEFIGTHTTSSTISVISNASLMAPWPLEMVTSDPFAAPTLAAVEADRRATLLRAVAANES